jgi:hypothetical protein
METNRYAPPGAAVEDLQEAGGAPPLWNPGAAANWSLLFTVVFGAWLHRENWRALGEPAKAEASRRWMIAAVLVLAVQVLVILFSPTSRGVALSNFLGALMLFVWYWASARGQARLVKERWGRDYPRRPWSRPLLTAVLAFAAWFAIAMVVTPGA